VKAARKAIAEKGEDAERCGVVGRYACFVKGDFAEGVKWLAKCEDPVLRGVANGELGAKEPSERVKVANGWWELAEGRGSIAGGNLRRHAAEIYREAVGRLKGLDRAGAEKRLEVYYGDLVKERGLEPGVWAELYRGSKFEPRVGTRVDRAIDFDWGTEAADARLPKDGFSIRWSGVLMARAGGRYELVVIANAGARVWINEKLVLEDGNLSRRRNGVRVLLELAGGLHEVKVEYWDEAGSAKMRLLWVEPGKAEAEAVPAEAWWREGYLGE
jgi:hypothetical protein